MRLESEMKNRLESFYEIGVFSVGVEFIKMGSVLLIILGVVLYLVRGTEFLSAMIAFAAVGLVLFGISFYLKHRIKRERK